MNNILYYGILMITSALLGWYSSKYLRRRCQVPLAPALLATAGMGALWGVVYENVHALIKMYIIN